MKHLANSHPKKEPMETTLDQREDLTFETFFGAPTEALDDTTENDEDFSDCAYAIAKGHQVLLRSLQLLILMEHVSREKVDEAIQIARTLV